MLFPRLHPELELCHYVPAPGQRNTQTSSRQGVPKPRSPAWMAPDKGTLLLHRASRGLSLAVRQYNPKNCKCCRQAVTARRRAGMISEPHVGDTARQEQSHRELLAQALEQHNCSRGFASCSETCSRSAVITSPCCILFDKHVIYDGIKKRNAADALLIVLIRWQRALLQALASTQTKLKRLSTFQKLRT